MALQNRLQMHSRRSRIHLLDTAHDLFASLEVERALEVCLRPARITSYCNGLPTRRPHRHRAGLKIDLGFVLCQNDRLRCSLAMSISFFELYLELGHGSFVA